jgi:hypothetical protein
MAHPEVTNEGPHYSKPSYFLNKNLIPFIDSLPNESLH